MQKVDPDKRNVCLLLWRTLNLMFAAPSLEEMLWMGYFVWATCSVLLTRHPVLNHFFFLLAMGEPGVFAPEPSFFCCFSFFFSSRFRSFSFKLEINLEAKNPVRRREEIVMSSKCRAGIYRSLKLG